MNLRFVNTASGCILALLAGGLLLAPPSARAAAHGSVTATASASVTILEPETLSSTQALAFGSIPRPASGQAFTVKVDTNDRITVSGKGDAAVRTAGIATAGVFEIAGPPNTVYALDQSLSFFSTGLSGATAAAGTPGGGALNVLPASGLQHVRVGGAFKIDPTAGEGTHSGFLAVTVNYN